MWQKYFPKENKTYMKQLVENLRKALGQAYIDNLSWMSRAQPRQRQERSLPHLPRKDIRLSPTNGRTIPEYRSDPFKELSGECK